MVLVSEEGKALLESGRVQGRLDADEVALALDELDLDAAQIDAFYDALDEEQIEVVAPDAEADAEAERAWEAAEPEISTDTLQLFLKDIGKVPLLTAAQEVELVERQRDLVRVEPALRATRLDERPPLVRREHDIRFRRRPFRVTRCSAQDRPFRRVARYGSHEVPTASTAPTGDQTPARASSSRYVWA